MAASYYPVDEPSSSERTQMTVRIPKELAEDIDSIVEIWNGLDVALGKSRPQKWKANSVIERLLQVGVDGFWAQIGGRPATKEARVEFIARAVEHLKHRPTKK